MSPARWLEVLWVVWLLGWLLASVWTAKTVTRQPAGAHFAQAGLIWAGAFLFFYRSHAVAAFTRDRVSESGWAAWVGVLAAVAGLAHATWARMHIGRFWSSDVTIKAGHTLIRTGPYAITRHPIYTGLLFALLGTTLARGSLSGVAGFVVMTLGLLLKIHQEEGFMIGRFGDAYRAYRADVPALIPGTRFLA